jgi:hypothetical protein
MRGGQTGACTVQMIAHYPHIAGLSRRRVPRQLDSPSVLPLRLSRDRHHQQHGTSQAVLVGNDDNRAPLGELGRQGRIRKAAIIDVADVGCCLDLVSDLRHRHGGRDSARQTQCPVSAVGRHAPALSAPLPWPRHAILLERSRLKIRLTTNRALSRPCQTECRSHHRPTSPTTRSQATPRDGGGSVNAASEAPRSRLPSSARINHSLTIPSYNTSHHAE